MNVAPTMAPASSRFTLSAPDKKDFVWSAGWSAGHTRPVSTAKATATTATMMIFDRVCCSQSLGGRENSSSRARSSDGFSAF
jgi:hypothetical protein